MKILIALAILIILSILSNCIRWRFDSTDDYRPDKVFGKRSGLYLYTDYGTGVQYIKSNWFGRLTPRLDKDGNVVVVTNE